MAMIVHRNDNGTLYVFGSQDTINQGLIDFSSARSFIHVL